MKKDEFNDEFGNQPEEFNKQPSEIVEYSEMASYAEAEQTPDEVKEYSEVAHPTAESVAKAKEKKDISNLKRILKTTSALVATVATVAVIAPTVFSSDDAVVNFGNISVTDTEVTCDITLENTSDNVYTAVLYNNFTEREKTIEGDSLQLAESSLKPNMKYTLAVKSDGDVIAKTVIKTMKSEDYKVTKWTTVDYKCNCSNDGTFQFIMSYQDENGWWSDFEATLTDSAGTVSTCTFTENLSAMQTIPVTRVLSGKTATFTITCISTENSENGEKITLFTSEVEI